METNLGGLGKCSSFIAFLSPDYDEWTPFFGQSAPARAAWWLPSPLRNLK